ncbi:MAG: purine-nucleoside phosphorylase [Candidatus Aquicultorales bacterium]
MFEEQVEEAFRFLSGKLGVKPVLGVILGSGLSRFARLVEAPSGFSFADIPHFPTATVPGHPGRLTAGRLFGLDAVVLEGRLHYYEGYSMAEIAFPVLLFKRLGVTTLVETCAAGSLAAKFVPGDIALISDHLNLMGDNPLRGRPADDRFVDMENAYSRRLRSSMRRAAEGQGLELEEAVYAAVAGPSYETPAESRFLSRHADLVGMSLVPEVIAARYCGIEVCALGIVTNSHVGEEHISHGRVVEVAGEIERDLEILIERFIDRIRTDDEGVS